MSASHETDVLPPPSAEAAPTEPRRELPSAPRRGLAVGAGAVAASAFAGAAVMASGLAFQVTRHHRLFYFDNPVADAIILSAVFGVPNVIVANYAWRGDQRANLAAITAGSLAMGWVSLDATRERMSVLDPIYGAIGIGLIVAGARGFRQS